MAVTAAMSSFETASLAERQRRTVTIGGKWVGSASTMTFVREGSGSTAVEGDLAKHVVATLPIWGSKMMQSDWLTWASQPSDRPVIRTWDWSPSGNCK
jgi:hypothetical protein